MFLFSHQTRHLKYYNKYLYFFSKPFPASSKLSRFEQMSSVATFHLLVVNWNMIESGGRGGLDSEQQRTSSSSCNKLGRENRRLDDDCESAFQLRHHFFNKIDQREFFFVFALFPDVVKQQRDAFRVRVTLERVA